MSVQTNIFEICQAMEDRLVSLEVVGERSQIVWSARRGPMPHVKGKFDVVLRPRRGQDLRSHEQGGQRYGMVCVRVVDVFIRSSYAGSEMSSDKEWYRIHIPLEDAVLDAFAGQFLTNSSGLYYLTCPIHYLGTLEEDKETAVPAKNLWGESAHSFEVHFKPKLDLTAQT